VTRALDAWRGYGRRSGGEPRGLQPPTAGCAAVDTAGWPLGAAAAGEGPPGPAVPRGESAVLAPPLPPLVPAAPPALKPASAASPPAAARPTGSAPPPALHRKRVRFADDDAVLVEQQQAKKLGSQQQPAAAVHPIVDDAAAGVNTPLGVRELEQGKDPQHPQHEPQPQQPQQSQHPQHPQYPQQQQEAPGHTQPIPPHGEPELPVNAWVSIPLRDGAPAKLKRWQQRVLDSGGWGLDERCMEDPRQLHLTVLLGLKVRGVGWVGWDACGGG